MIREYRTVEEIASPLMIVRMVEFQPLSSGNVV